jgi:hypothetical protein
MRRVFGAGKYFENTHYTSERKYGIIRGVLR